MTPLQEGKVRHPVTDGPYGWDTAYRAVRGPEGVAVNVRIQMRAGAGVGSDDLAKVQRETTEAAARWYDGRFALRDGNGAEEHPLRVGVQFVDSDPDLRVTVRAGAGRDNLENWHVKSGVAARGHEIGHALGLRDEYVDSTVTARATPQAAEVRRDGSLMGNFYAEGADRAELKERHGKVLAADLSQALGCDLRVAPAQGVSQGPDAGGPKWFPPRP